MFPATDLEELVLTAWSTNSRVTSVLVSQIPAGLWTATIPEVPTRSVRAMAAHLHNSRCSWVRTLGREHGIPTPTRVNHRTVTRRELVPALGRSGRAIAALLRLGCRRGGRIPPSKAYVWRNLPLDVGHVLTYFAVHEAHHRGQIVLAARQLDCRLPAAVTNGLWQWSTLLREQRGKQELPW